LALRGSFSSPLPFPSVLTNCRILGAYAWRTFLDNNVTVPFGSDFPVPFLSEGQREEGRRMKRN